jgi:hypothetical protein
MISGSGKMRCLEKSPPQCHLVHHKSLFFTGWLMMLSILRLYGIRWYDDMNGNELGRTWKESRPNQSITTALLEGTEENHKNETQSDSQCPGQDLNQTPS